MRTSAPAVLRLASAPRPWHQSVRWLRGSGSRAPGHAIVSSGDGDDSESFRKKNKDLQRMAAKKNMPVSHFGERVDPLSDVADIKDKYAPFMKKTRHRVEAPYVNDRSLAAAQVNKTIFPVFPNNKSARIWPAVKEEVRARRMLPVPVSMTGLGLDDGTSARYWTIRIMDWIKQMERDSDEADSPNFLDNVTPAVRMMLEQDPDSLSEDHKQLLQRYKEAKDQEKALAEKEPESTPVIFPHSLTTQKIREKVDEQVVLYQQEDKQLLDQEYSQYLKHRRVLSYLSEGMKGERMEKDEFDGEMMGWRDSFWRRSYGTPDPNMKPSDVPCGGCGALIHCCDPGLPGYMPSEKFANLSDRDKKREVCQRCDFLHHFNVSLDVNVPPDEYPAILSKIRQDKKAIVLLMVDLTDFPCSIWPDVFHVFGEKRKVFVLGNKVDLLPPDGKDFLERMRESLRKSLSHAGVDPANKVVFHNLMLISAKTGFGIEDLITRLFSAWDGKSDVYLIGCTNVGKSTLFNALLQSDLCATRDNDLIQRATTSLWPGTTLSLLKFPIAQLEGWQMHKRELRLRYREKVKAAEHVFRQSLYRQTGNVTTPQIIDRIGMTFHKEVPFTVSSGHPFARKTQAPIPFDENPKFKGSKFLFDTPGSVYEDQLLSLLTTEELLKTVPRSLITPRTFTVQPFQSLFIAGLGRIDVLHSRQNVLLTVFASKYLPVHVVYTQEAGRFYQLFLGSELLAVPCGSEERLSLFPPLVPKELEFKGIDWRTSCADVVLSSAGWVAVTMGEEEESILKAWTPDGRGIFVRRPALLPHAVNMRGRRIPDTPCYKARVLNVNEFDEESDPVAHRRQAARDERSESLAYTSFKFRDFDDGRLVSQEANMGWEEYSEHELQDLEKGQRDEV